MLLLRCGNPFGTKAWLPADSTASSTHNAVEEALEGVAKRSDVSPGESGMADLPDSILNAPEPAPSTVTGPESTLAQVPEITAQDLAGTPENTAAETGATAPVSSSAKMSGAAVPAILALGGFLLFGRPGGDTPVIASGGPGGGTTGGTGGSGGGTTGGSSGGGSGGTTGGGGVGTNPVPEPSGAIVVGIGLVALAARRRK